MPNASLSNMERREVYYRGLVQGVGFRYTTRGIAARFDVSGYVKNLSDGRVYLVAEGKAGELDRFLGAIQSRMDRYIDDADVTTSPATGEFRSFDIRF